MKVAYFYPWIFCNGGAERVIVELLKRTKHDFDIYTFCYEKENTFPEFEQYNITELAHLDVKGVISRGMRFGFNALYRKIPNLKSYDVFNVATSGVAELITIRNHSIPTLCFCHTTLRPVHEMYDYYKSKRFTGWKRIPFIASSIGYRSIERSAWRHMDFVLCNSLNTKNRIINAGLANDEKVEVLNPGVDTKRFKRKRYDHYFLAPGRIQWYKRFELAIDAFKSFQKRAKTKFKLKIVGGVSEKDTPVLEFLRDRAKGVKDVEFIINSSDEEMTKLYSNCYAVLFTAKDEDWGIVPLEAMASGKPVVSVNEGGPRESIVSGENGFLVNADPEEFAEKMLHLAENPSLVKKMGRSGMESVKRYDWKHFVKRYDEHIERLSHKGQRLA